MKKFIANIIQTKKKEFFVAAAGFLALIVLVGGILLYQVLKPEQKQPEPDIQISIEKIIEKNHLNTLQYPVERAVSVSDKNGKNIKYYVAYEGKVVLGIDMSKVKIDQIQATTEGEKSKVVITIPNAEIQDPIVAEDSLDYIFKKGKYETETVYEEAYRACKKDLKAYAASNPEQLKYAKERAISEVKALLLPLEDAIKDQWILEVK